jgi:hypothetical protein
MANNGKVTKTYMLEQKHEQLIKDYAAKMGYPSESSSLRRILDEWEDFRRHLLVDSKPMYQVNG